MMSNFRMGVKSNKDKYGEGFLYFAIRALKDKFGCPERYIFSELLREGLKNHPQFRDEYPGLLAGFQRLQEAEPSEGREK